MTLVCRILLLGWLPLALFTSGLPAQHSAKGDKPPPVRVTLRFSVEELDPKDPKDSLIECIVRNESKEAIKVPTTYKHGYDDRSIILNGGQLYLVSKNRDAKQMLVNVEPGKELTVFKAPLRELLLTANGKDYYWTWDA
jgi:hypothetical protein